MKIRLVVVAADVMYLKKITDIFTTKFEDKLEVYSFSDIHPAMEILEKNRINVMLVDDSFTMDTDQLPQHCGFAYLVESSNIETVRGQRAIGKFQKVDLIYKQILSIYSEHGGGNTPIYDRDSESCKLFTFISAAGGVGTSCAAAACAAFLAERGRRVLYLNLETYSSTDVFFRSEGQFDMTDIVYALKSRKTNFTIKLESCVKQDSYGVYFFSSPKMALDIMEMSIEDIKRFISELRLSGLYECIVLDTDFDLRDKGMFLLAQSNRVIMVNDGSQIANIKTMAACRAISAIEQEKNVSILSRMNLLYNKFSNQTSEMLEQLDLHVIGGIPKFKHATAYQIMQEIISRGVFEELLLQMR